jgi:hypothetical protein
MGRRPKFKPRYDRHSRGLVQIQMMRLKSLERALRNNQSPLFLEPHSMTTWRSKRIVRTRTPPLPANGERIGVRGQGFELGLISAHSQPSCPALCRASTPVNRETHRAETGSLAPVLTFGSPNRVDGRDKRGHDAARLRLANLDSELWARGRSNS